MALVAVIAGLPFVALALAADVPVSRLPAAVQCVGAAAIDDSTCRLWLHWQEVGKELRAHGLSLDDVTSLSLERAITPVFSTAARQLAGSSHGSSDSHNTTADASQSHGEDSHDSHGAGGHHVHSKDAFLFMFVALAFGCIINYGLSRIAPTVPYTVTLYLLGMLLGFLDNRVRANGEPTVFSQSVVMWSHIDPHMMLQAFLPALLFGDAFGINRHQFYKSLASCTILATVGVLYGTLVTGVIIHYLAPKNITFYEACTAGSIFSATDPVAVVAILKALGASAKLNMLISGESLMNDGVALVIYSIFHNLSLGQEYTAGEVIVFFIRLFGGGVLLGFAFGIITYLLLSVINSRIHHDDTLIQTGIMFCAAYLSFWVGESENVHVSGVLACVVCSITVGFYGPQLLVEREKVLHVWHFAEWVGNTLLFLLAGAIIGDSLVSDELSMNAGEVLWVLALYVLLVLVRGLVVFTFFPLLRKMGYGLQWQEAAVMVWGGLRGAVGLALAVEMGNTSIDKLGDALDADAIGRRKYILFQVGMFTTLTLVINAPTTGFWLRKLGLIRTTTMQELILKGHETRLADASQEFYDMYKEHKIFAGHTPEVVKGVLAAVCHGHIGKEARRSLTKHIAECENDPDALPLFRMSFMRLVTAEYWMMVDHGVLPVQGDILIDLVASVDHAKDYLHEHRDAGLKDWEYLMNLFSTVKSFQKCVKSCGWLGRASTKLAEQHTITTILCFIGAHEEAQKRAMHHLPGIWQEHIVQESKKCVEQAEAFLAENLDNRDVQEVKSVQMSSTILGFQRTKVEKWVAYGIITEGEAHHMKHHIDHGTAYLDSIHSVNKILPMSLSHSWSKEAVGEESVEVKLEDKSSEAHKEEGKASEAPTTTEDDAVKTDKEDKASEAPKATEDEGPKTDKSDAETEAEVIADAK
eukprot:TRINITY_DN13879_c0_g2_i1.p1 TRINITY_DN13879_c0_g2~~TRINITY_DN13879_c0_g2_i1.p1  ORF type:complete len:924 (-),score=156.68 TRINITY_DN13879_c0_g2_i1:406-3177(-)